MRYIIPIVASSIGYVMRVIRPKSTYSLNEDIDETDDQD